MTQVSEVTEIFETFVTFVTSVAFSFHISTALRTRVLCVRRGLWSSTDARLRLTPLARRVKGADIPMIPICALHMSKIPGTAEIASNIGNGHIYPVLNRSEHLRHREDHIPGQNQSRAGIELHETPLDVSLDFQNELTLQATGWLTMCQPPDDRTVASSRSDDRKVVVH